MLDRKLGQDDFGKIYSDYMKQMPEKTPPGEENKPIPGKWEGHPLSWIFTGTLPEFHKELLAIVGKPYSQKWVSEYNSLGGVNRRKTRRLKRPKHPILKKHRKTRRPRKPVGRRFSRKLSNKKKYTR